MDLNYKKPIDRLLSRGYKNALLFIVPVFDLNLNGFFRVTKEQFLLESQITFDNLPEGTATESTQGIPYYGVKYTVLLPSSNPTPEQFVDSVKGHVKDRFYTLKKLGQQVYRIDPIDKTNDFYRQRYTEIIGRAKELEKIGKRKKQEMVKRDIKKKLKTGDLRPRRFNDSDGKNYFDPKEWEQIKKTQNKRKRRFRSRSKSPPPRDRPPIKPMQKLKL